jgi:hypothetical protein
MSILSNHYIEILDIVNGGPPEPGCPPCACPLDGTGVYEMCPACQADYFAYREMADADLPLPGEEYERRSGSPGQGPAWDEDEIVEILPEPSDPLPDDMPF